MENLTAPEVNLLPPQAVAAVKNRRARLFALTIPPVVLLVWGFVFLTGYQTHQNLVANLESETQTNQQLEQELTQLQPVINLKNQTDQLVGTVDNQMGQRVEHSTIINRFATITTNTLIPAQLTLQTGPGTTCDRSDPFSQTPISGCLVFTGQATTPGGASELLRTLQNETIFVDAFIPSMTEQQNTNLTINGSTSIGVSAYTTTEQENQ